jgi:hypothetical protein
MDGLPFGSWPSVDVAEDSGRSLSGLAAAVGPAVVGHAEILQRAADIEGKLAGVLPVALDRKMMSPPKCFPTFSVDSQ